MDKILILDFGGQYNQLIARRVRECNVYCEVKPYTMPLAEIRAFAPHRHHLHRRAATASTIAGSPQVDPEIFALGIPILGICYGCQLMAQTLGGRGDRRVGSDTAREYGKTETYFRHRLQALRAACRRESITWMSHGDYMAKVPEWLPARGPFGRLPQRSAICDESRGLLRRAVPPGGQSHRARSGHAAQLPL